MKMKKWNNEENNAMWNIMKMWKYDNEEENNEEMRKRIMKCQW